VTKRELARYYETVARAMLPHVSDRFITAVRCPKGPTGAGDCFYQKHPEKRGWPGALRAAPVQDRGGVASYFYVDHIAGLLALVQLGVLEIHVWNSLVTDPERPDRIVFDLDPGPDVTWEGVVAAAVTVRDAVRALDLEAFPKTTGGRGIHVVVPIVPEHDYDAVRDLTHALCERLAAHDPSTFTAKMAKGARPGRVFIDYLRNAHGATAVCAYSTRARPGGPVSMPVSWEELAAGLDPSSVTHLTVPGMLASRKADPWRGYEASRARLGDAHFAALGLPAPGA
jgi:bifunctional non-homologous end joining protein LigD